MESRAFLEGPLAVWHCYVVGRGKARREMRGWHGVCMKVRTHNISDILDQHLLHYAYSIVCGVAVVSEAVHQVLHCKTE